jgi:hypothetical protein
LLLIRVRLSQVETLRRRLMIFSCLNIIDKDIVLAESPPKIEDVTTDISKFVCFTGAICENPRLIPLLMLMFMFTLIRLQAEGNAIIPAESAVETRKRYLPLSSVARANNIG